MNIIDHGSHFAITIPFNNWFARNLKAVKELPEKRWMAMDKFWWIPGTLREEVIDLSLRTHARIIPFQELTPEITGEIGEIPMPTYPIVVSEKAPAPPRPYQKQGVARCIDFKRIINGDEQGLGKTMQTIVSLCTAQQQGHDVFPVLIICPATLKENWRREWETWSNKSAMVLTDGVRNTWYQYWKMGLCQVFIVNYESLKKYFVDAMPSKGKINASKDIVMKPTIDLFKTVVVDESHRCKDTTRLQTKLTLRIAHKKEWVILLTGTPIKGKPVDIYPQLCIMNQQHHFGGTKTAFLNRYMFGGRPSNLRELNYLLNQHCYFRREKKDVAKDLPEKQRQKIICDITTREEYQRALNNFRSYLRTAGFTEGQMDAKMRAQALVQMNVLRQISARGKIAEVREFVDEIMEAGEKLILFCTLREIVQQLKQHYPDSVTITGDDTGDRRQRHIDAFQKDPNVQLIICNIAAAGVGVTLTASSRVAFVEFPWTYADAVQCEDRAHRIGQRNNVMCSYFLGVDTIDEKIFNIIMEKKDIHQAITGSSDMMEMSTVDKVLNLFSAL